MEKNMAHMRKNHSSSASLLAYETVLLWRENSGWDLRHFSCLQYILGRNSVIWLVKYSTELKLIKGNNKKELKKNMKRNGCRLIVFLYTWNTTSSTYKLCRLPHINQAEGKLLKYQKEKLLIFFFSLRKVKQLKQKTFRCSSMAEKYLSLSCAKLWKINYK